MIHNPFTSSDCKYNPLHSFYLSNLFSVSKETIMSENFNLDTLLDGTLDDLADAPEFRPYPAGTHKVILTLVQKPINNKPAFEANFKAVETIELANPGEDTPLAPGAQASVAFILDNEYGQGGLKNVLKAAAEKFGAKSNRELIADIQNAEAAIVTSLRANKDKTAYYTNLIEIAFL
jgi:hypothetical protein